MYIYIYIYIVSSILYWRRWDCSGWRLLLQINATTIGYGGGFRWLLSQLSSRRNRKPRRVRRKVFISVSEALPVNNYVQEVLQRERVCVDAWVVERESWLRKEFAIDMYTEMNANGFSSVEREYIRNHHRHYPAENQCSSALVKHIKAPVHLVILSR